MIPRLRRTAGTILWDSPILRRRVREALEHGTTLNDLARAWRVSRHVVYYHAARLDWTVLPEDRVGIAEAADALNLTPIGVYALCRRQGVAMGHWGQLRTLSQDQLAALLTRRDRVVHERPHGYVTAAELASAWGLAAATVRVRLAGLPRLAWLGGAGRVQFLYDLREASRLAPRVGPATCPRGCWTGSEIAAALGVPPPVVTGWTTGLGCPAVRGRKNYYYRPDAVAAWLLSRKKRHMRAYGERLRELLATRAGEAA